MAAWLFCPETIEYRDGVFLREQLSAANADNWIEQFEGDVPRAERKINMLVLWDTFSTVDLEPYLDGDLQQLADAIGECWRGVLAQRYPQSHDHC